MPKLLQLILLALLAGPWGTAISAELKVVFSQYTPPYVLEKGDGIVVDIVRAALEPAGYKIDPVFAPMGRGLDLYAKKRVDGITTIRESSRLSTNYSDAFIQYHNRVFSLAESGYAIKTMADIKDRSIIAFQDAHKYLGNEFSNAVAGNRRYQEMANQEKQTLALLLGKADLIVMDESVFHYYREKLIAEEKVARSVEVSHFSLFPPTPYKAAFSDPKVRDDFNLGLDAIRRNGRYQAIYKKYIDEYFVVKQ